MNNTLENEKQMTPHDVYQGKRSRRGLFKLSNGKTINADVNRALNIMKGTPYDR